MKQKWFIYGGVFLILLFLVLWLVRARANKTTQQDEDKKLIIDRINQAA